MTKEERMYEFGHRLDKFMTDMNVDGATVSDLSGVSHTEITRARRGVLMLSRKCARKIAAALKRPEDSFDDLYLPDCLEDEEWRPLKRYPDYMGSNRGRILNPNTGRIMKNIQDRRGKPKVQLSINGKKYSARVHDLIEETFEY